ncbi:MAG: hypothetical protein AAGD07_24845, partial [Planctomycetota bacterium]
MQRPPLLASYGGGHANIIASMAHGLMAQGINPTILGFTTGYRSLCRSGLRAHTVSMLIDGFEEEYQSYRKLAAPFLPASKHPDITVDEALDYFSIGLRDLVQDVGETQALGLMRAKGRKAFQPERTMRNFLQRLRPGCVITTTSPRFELALIRAARRLDIPTLAIADLYLQREREWVLSGEYAEHLCVLDDALRDDLLETGLPEGMTVHVTGNPAFDKLLAIGRNPGKRDELRRQLGVGERRLILWPAAPVQRADFSDRSFASPAQVANVFDRLCETVPDYAYMLRPHPNGPFELPASSRHGMLDPGLAPEEALIASDIVCFEVSTMGLQASLLGLPVICVGFPEIAVFP